MDTADVSEGDTCAVEGFVTGWIIDPPQDPLVSLHISIAPATGKIRIFNPLCLFNKCTFLPFRCTFLTVYCMFRSSRSFQKSGPAGAH